MLDRPLSILSRILVGVTERALDQRREATCLGSHSRGRAELEFDPIAPGPNPQRSILRSSQPGVCADFLQAQSAPWAVRSTPSLPFRPRTSFLFLRAQSMCPLGPKLERKLQLWIQRGLNRSPRHWQAVHPGEHLSLSELRSPCLARRPAGQVLCRLRGAVFRMSDISGRTQCYTPQRGNFWSAGSMVGVKRKWAT